MYNLIHKITVALLLSLMSLSSWAYVLGTTDVGVLDTYLDSTGIPDPLSSGEGAEEDWANAVLAANGYGSTTFYIGKNEDMTASLVEDTTGEADPADQRLVYAFEFNLEDEGSPVTSSPDFFLIKNTSSQQGSAYALFENNESFSWGVIDIWALDLGFNLIKQTEDGYALNIEISHVTGFGDDSVEVSEPGTLLLLGFGLVGLSLTRRKIAA